jgi:hypothetical protein
MSPILLLPLSLFFATCIQAANLIDESWQHGAPREEIAPKFRFDAKGGKEDGSRLSIEAGEVEGLSGYWFKSVPVKGGQHYRMSVSRKTEGVDTPRRCTFVRVVWQNDDGKSVPFDGPTVTSVLKGWKPTAEPEYPADRATDRQGWTEVSDTLRAPAAATRATIELHLQWASHARVDWSQVAFDPVAAPVERKARLAAVHYRPQGGKTPAGNCRLFAPLIADAAKQRADLVVLPETLTYYGLGTARPTPSARSPCRDLPRSISARSLANTISTSWPA